MATLSLMLLGGFQARSEAGATITISAKKAKALLAYLALHPGQFVSRDKLAALLWEEHSETQARGSLRSTLTSLRKVLPAADLLTIEDDRLAVAPAGIDVDVLEFERLTAIATPPALERAIDLYQGELLEGFNPRAPAFEDWLMGERSRLQEQALAAMTALLDHYLAVQANERAIQLAIRLLNLDPLREAAHRTLMMLYARQRHYSAAFKQYRACQAILRRELGVAPEPATERLYRDLVQQRHKPASDVPQGKSERQQSPAVRETTVTPPASAVVEPPVATAPTDAELRQVTVLVAQLAEAADAASGFEPVDRYELISHYEELVTREIEHYGGLITDRHAASLTAVFGLPMALGNDTERAVRAASDIQRQMANDAGAWRIRIGIASGRVLVGSSGDIDFRTNTITSDVFDAARQLAARADAGNTLLSDAVYASVARQVLAKPWGDPGVPAATGGPVWRLQTWRECPLQEQPALVGRRQELRQLTAALDACIETERGQTFLIRGEAGIGKTRLVEEFTAIAAARGFSIHKALVFNFGTATGQEAIHTLVRSLLNLPPDCSSGQAQALIEQVLGDALVEPEQQAFLNDLLDIPQPLALSTVFAAMDSATRHRGTQALVVWLVEALSQHQPLLLIIEDIHWADTDTLSFLACIAATAGDCPTLLVLTSRVEGEPLNPEWRGAMQGAPLATLDLGPLREHEALALAQALGSPDNRLARHCVDRARGNPLFLEQLLRAGGGDGIPDSVQGIVWARLDRLMPNDRQAIQAASVIGQCFALPVLRHLIDDPHYTCARLIEQHLVRPAAEQYLFVHALIMESIYESILPDKRRAWHRRAAAWFCERDSILYAEHLERAGNPAAPLAYLKAARAQAQAHHQERALALIQRGLLLVHEPETEFELTCLHGDLLHRTGRVKAAIDEFEHALSLVGDHHRRCRALLGLATGLSVEDRYQEALATLDQAEHLAQQPGCAAELAEIHYQRGNLLFPLGHIERCLEEHELARRYAQQAASPRLEACALSGLGDAWYQRGRMRTAYTYFDRCIVLCREHGFARIEVANLPMRGAVRFFLNDLSGCLENNSTVVERAIKIGYQRAELLARVGLAEGLLEIGDWQGVLEQAEKGLMLARRLGARRFEAESLSDSGEALARLGQRTKAEQQLEAAFTISRESGLTYNGSWILGALALVTDDAEKREWALAEGERILHQDCVSHNYLFFYQRAMEACLHIKDWERVPYYAAALEEYTHPEPLPWSAFYIARGRVLAAHGQGRRSSELLAELQHLCETAEGVGLKAALPALKRAIAEW